MSTVLKFDKLTRLGDDPCGINDKDLQNQKIGSYLTQNHFEKYCGMETPIQFATSQPNVFYSAGVGTADSCNIDNDSKFHLYGCLFLVAFYNNKIRDLSSEIKGLNPKTINFIKDWCFKLVD